MKTHEQLKRVQQEGKFPHPLPGITPPLALSLGIERV